MDTNVLVAGLRSRRGYAFRLLQLVGRGHFEINLSVPLVLEYEEVLYRELPNLSVPQVVVDAVIDYHCRVANHHRIFFLWRPFLRDPDDDMVLEVAVKARCDFIVTYNLRDFQGIEQFGLQAITPRDFLREIGVIK
jgi:putative PIN family toxin of toxin-antitoxin system